MVIGHRNRGRIKRIRFENVCARFEVFVVNRANHGGPRQREQIVIAAQIAFPIGKSFATIFGFRQSIALNHRAHRAVEDENALHQRAFESGGAGGACGKCVIHFVQSCLCCNYFLPSPKTKNLSGLTDRFSWKTTVSL